MDDLSKHVSSVWPLDVIRELKRRWEDGETSYTIAKAMNRTRGSILGKVHRLELESHPSPIKPKGTGADPRAGKPKRTQGRTLPSMGWAPPPLTPTIAIESATEKNLAQYVTKEWSLADVIELHRLWMLGEPNRRIGHFMHRTTSTISGKRARMGLFDRQGMAPGVIAKTIINTGQQPAAGKSDVESAAIAALELKPEQQKRVDFSQVPGALAILPSGRPGLCQWPIGVPKRPDFRFCHSPDVVEGKPYCAEHCARAYVPTLKPNLFVRGGLSRAPEQIEDAQVSG